MLNADVRKWGWSNEDAGRKMGHFFRRPLWMTPTCKANDKPFAATTRKYRYSVAEVCANILDCDEESLLGNNFDLAGINRAYRK